MFVRWFVFAILGVVVLMPASVLAAPAEGDEPPKASAEERLAKLVDLGPGVHAIKKGKKGQILSCIVVGQARISTVLGKAKGIEIARDKANLAASAEFVKWLKEEVTVYQSSNDESVTLTEGTEEKDGDSQKESGKAIEHNSKKMESLSKGLVRGLQIIGKDVDGEGKTYTIVKGFRADTADATKKLSKDLASDEPEATGTKPGTKDEGSKPSTTTGDKKIKSKKVTSEAADDFLP